MKKLFALLLPPLAILALLSVATSQKSASPSGRTVVTAKDAPPPIGPYSQAIKVGEFVFCAGQTARDPVTNKLIEGDVSAQTDRVLKNMADFNAMNEVYGKYFKDSPPARATVGVAALPVDALVEIETIAVLPGK